MCKRIISFSARHRTLTKRYVECCFWKPFIKMFMSVIAVVCLRYHLYVSQKAEADLRVILANFTCHIVILPPISVICCSFQKKITSTRRLVSAYSGPYITSLSCFAVFQLSSTTAYRYFQLSGAKACSVLTFLRCQPVPSYECWLSSFPV